VLKKRIGEHTGDLIPRRGELAASEGQPIELRQGPFALRGPDVAGLVRGGRRRVRRRL
jgi:hypothetical protein